MQPIPLTLALKGPTTPVEEETLREMRREAAYLGKHLRSIRRKKGRGRKKKRKDLGGEIKTSWGAAGVCDAATLEGGISI